MQHDDALLMPSRRLFSLALQGTIGERTGGGLRAFGSGALAATRLIGIDVGTTAHQGHADRPRRQAAGRVLARRTRSRGPQPGHAEQDPDDWMGGVLAALASFARPTTTSRASPASASARRSTRMSSSAPTAGRCCRRSSGRTGGSAPDAAALDAQVTRGAEARAGSAHRSRSTPATRWRAWRMCGASDPEIYARDAAMCCCPRTIA